MSLEQSNRLFGFRLCKPTAELLYLLLGASFTSSCAAHSRHQRASFRATSGKLSVTVVKSAFRPLVASPILKYASLGPCSAWRG